MTQDNDTEAYLARIRKTIAESERMVEAVHLRMAETDRMLARQGLTREQVMNMRFNSRQIEAAKEFARREGVDESVFDLPEETVDVGAQETFSPSELGSTESFSPDAGSTDTELEHRKQKFAMFMKPFQI